MSDPVLVGIGAAVVLALVLVVVLVAAARRRRTSPSDGGGLLLIILVRRGRADQPDILIRVSRKAIRYTHTTAGPDMSGDTGPVT